jgi:hypothetical protein
MNTKYLVKSKRKHSKKTGKNLSKRNSKGKHKNLSKRNSKGKHINTISKGKSSKGKGKSSSLRKSSSSNSIIMLGDELKDSADISTFRKSKSISIASRLTDVKDTQIGELTDMKPIHDVMSNLCISKMSKKKYIMPDTGDMKPINKKLATSVCECLFEKNRDLSVNELEKKVRHLIETPASGCINILDKHFETS